MFRFGPFAHREVWDIAFRPEKVAWLLGLAPVPFFDGGSLDVFGILRLIEDAELCES